jgi:hypothetical protein
MKIKKTFTIDSQLWSKFDLMCKEKSINKSLYIENSIKKLINEYVVDKKGKS